MHVSYYYSYEECRAFVRSQKFDSCEVNMSPTLPNSGNFYNTEKHSITCLSEGGITCKPGGHPEKIQSFWKRLKKLWRGALPL